MANVVDLVNWSGRKDISFILKSTEMRGVKDINISASLDTEDNEGDGEKYTKKKNSGAYEITLTAVLNAALGVNVQHIALEMTEAARCGNSGYFYIATKKLFPSKFMATDAKISNLQITSKGVWSYCEVAFTLKQASKFDGSSASSSSSSSSGSTSSGGGGGGGTRSYKVQIPGMSVVTVKASSVQGAITQACGSNWTGTIYVDGTAYYVVKGKITTQTAAQNAKAVTTAVNNVKTAVTTVVNNVKNAVTNFFSNLTSAKTQSNAVTTDANTKKTTTTTVAKPASKVTSTVSVNLKLKNLVK